MFTTRRITTMGSDIFRDEYSLSFDGSNDFVQIPDSSDFNFSNGSASIFSVSAWYKNTDSTPDTYASIVAKNDTGADKREFRLSVDDNDKIVCVVSNDGSTVLSNTSTFTVDDTKWHHVVMTYDGSVGTANLRCQIYVDGVDVLTTGHASNPAILNEDDAPITIGAHLNSGVDSGEWTGNISDVAIYNSALTASQVKTIYNDRKPYNHKEGVASGNLKAWYRMGDGVIDRTSLIGHGDTGGIADMSNYSLGTDVLGGKGDFSDPSYWDVSNNTEGNAESVVEGGVGKWLVTAEEEYGHIRKTSVLTENKVYLAKVTCSVNAGASVSLNFGDPYPKLIASGATGTFTTCFLAEGTGVVLYACPYTAAVTIDNITVQEVSGNPGAMKNMISADFEGDTP